VRCVHPREQKLQDTDYLTLDVEVDALHPLLSFPTDLRHPVPSVRMTSVMFVVRRAKHHQISIVIVVAVAEDLGLGDVTLRYFI